MFLVLRDPLLSTFAAKECAGFSAAGAYICDFLPVFAASRVRGPERRAGAPETCGEA